MRNEIKVIARLLSVDGKSAYIEIGDSLLKIDRSFIAEDEAKDNNSGAHDLIEDIFTMCERYVVQDAVLASKEHGKRKDKERERLAGSRAAVVAPKPAKASPQPMARPASKGQPEAATAPVNGIDPQGVRRGSPEPPEEDPELLPVCLVNEEAANYRDGKDIDLVDFIAIRRDIESGENIDTYAKILSEYPLSERMKMKELMSFELRQAIVSYCKMRDGARTLFTPADEAEFLDTENMGMEAFKLRLHNDSAKVPNDFEKTGVAAVLRGQVQRRNSSFELPKKT